MVVQFFQANQYQEECCERYRYYRQRIINLLPSATVEHIGSSAIPNVISKGDLDIFVGVEAADFDVTIRLLSHLGFQEKQDTLRTAELCMLELLSENIALQVVVKGSKFECFLTFRDKLRSTPTLVEAYNTLKTSCIGQSAEEYRTKKAAFIQQVLENAD